MVRHNKCHIGAYDNGQHNHFRLTTGGQGQYRLNRGGEPKDKDAFDYNEGQADQDCTKPDCGHNITPQLAHRDPHAFYTDSQRAEIFRGPDRLGRGACG